MSVNDKAPSGTNTSQWLRPLKGKFSDEADKRRRAIWDTTDRELVCERTFYLSEQHGDDQNDGRTPESAWKTIDCLTAHKEEILPQSAVLFERGGVYRGAFFARQGVFYGAYGEGDKPCIYGSRRNLATVLWQPTDKEHLWKCDGFSVDIGIVVFEHGKYIGRRKVYSLDDVGQNFEFYYGDGVLYLYMDLGNPADVFTSIEAGEKTTLMDLPSCTDGNVTVENLCFKYTGGHAVSGAELKDITVRNCEFGWIGGSILGKGPVRYGNAFELWGSCDNVLVENCWIYQCYDTGITFQTGQEGGTQQNLVFRNNLLEYCWWTTEMWNSGGEKAHTENILIEGNHMRFAGYGWGDQRNDVVNATNVFSMIKGAKNFVIKDNILEGSLQTLARASGARYENNVYAQNYNKNFPSMGYDPEGRAIPFDETVGDKIRAIYGDENPTIVYMEL